MKMNLWAVDNGEDRTVKALLHLQRPALQQEER